MKLENIRQNALSVAESILHDSTSLRYLKYQTHRIKEKNGSYQGLGMWREKWEIANLWK